MFGIDDWILTKFFLWKKFDSRSNLKIKRRIAGNKKSKKAIFFFPYWTGNSNLYKKLSKDFEDYTHVFMIILMKFFLEIFEFQINIIERSCLTHSIWFCL
jgi:hypothetical protein